MQVEERKLCDSLNGLASQLTAQAAEMDGGAGLTAATRRRTPSKKRKASGSGAVAAGDDGEAVAKGIDSSPPGSPGTPSIVLKCSHLTRPTMGACC